MEKTVSEAIKYRRSVRRFDKNLEIDDNIVKKCIENAVLAPTSSNLQLWEFYHITDKNLIKMTEKLFWINLVSLGSSLNLQTYWIN